MCKSRGVFFSFKHQIQSNHVSDADATNVALLSPEDNWSNSRPKEINEAAYGHSLHHYSWGSGNIMHVVLPQHNYWTSWEDTSTVHTYIRLAKKLAQEP